MSQSALLRIKPSQCGNSRATRHRCSCSKHHDGSVHGRGNKLRGFVVVVYMRFIDLIVRVPMALLVRMPSVLTMLLAGLKTLALARGGTLLLASIVVESLAITTPILLALTMSIVAMYAVQPIGLAMVRKMAKLAHVALLELTRFASAQLFSS